jgi:geranylgeranyl pyrophosphate synthase
MSTKDILKDFREEFEEYFQNFIDNTFSKNEQYGLPVRYILSGNGKRVRAALSMMVCEALGCDKRAGMPAGIAVEMIHAYSLVHDDLPCMDDDDIRRGRPSAHKQFNEATALLAGDGLLTDAFSILSGEEAYYLATSKVPSAEQRLKLVSELSSAAGGKGMVMGQALDLFWTAREGASKSDLDEIHLKKTGCMIGAAAAMGAICADADDKTVSTFRDFGLKIGLAYQVVDDLLDTKEGTGKSVGKDRESGKLTYLTGMSADEAAKMADKYTDEAVSLLNSVDGETKKLVEFTKALLKRKK